MMTQTIHATGASSTAPQEHTALTLPESAPKSAPHLYKIFDFRNVVSRGAEDEMDIDDYIEAQDAGTRAAIADAAVWVADEFYANKRTLSVLRLRAKMTQRQLADKCGVEQPHISRYESGRVEPKITHASKMAEALGVTLDDFVQAFKNSA
jgi:DNA-binding XRE family transcriptional regulator